MSPHKAPREDGFLTLFYHHCWVNMAPSLYHFVSVIQNESSLISLSKNTLFMLIPKIYQLEFLTHFRFVALCNVIYRLVSKIMVNHVLPFLNNIISLHKSIFILWRNIYHNIIIWNKMVHAKKKMESQKVFMLIKIDLDNAYDILNWKFVTKCLQDFKFPEEIINLTYHYIYSSYSKHYGIGTSQIVLPSSDVFVKVILYLPIFLLFV